MVGETIRQAVGRRMAEAMAKRQEFDFWWAFTAHSEHSCGVCQRFYSYTGWLRRHYVKTGHWKREEERR